VESKVVDSASSAWGCDVQVSTEEEIMRSVGHESQEKWLWEFEAVN
jgi:hypothetical protein